jgi:hypothetical protein
MAIIESAAPDPNLDGLPPGLDLTDGSLAADGANYDPDKFNNRFNCVVRCVHVGQDEDADDGVVTVAKFKHAGYEEGIKLKFRIKAHGDFLDRTFKVRGLYELVLRSAPILPDGRTGNIRLDEEKVSIILESASIGTGRPQRKEGDRVALLGFGLYDDEKMEFGHGDVMSCGLQVQAEGAYLIEEFELMDAYRVAIRTAPDWVKQKEADKAQGAKPFSETPLGAAIAAAEQDDEQDDDGPFDAATYDLTGLVGMAALYEGAKDVTIDGHTLTADEKATLIARLREAEAAAPEKKVAPIPKSTDLPASVADDLFSRVPGTKAKRVAKADKAGKL